MIDVDVSNFEAIDNRSMSMIDDDEKCFCRGKFLLGLFALFSLCQMFFHTRKTVYQHSHHLRNAEPRRCGPFEVKNGGKK